MDINECYKIEDDRLQLEEAIDSGFTNCCFLGSYNSKPCFIKVTRCENDKRLRKEKEALHIVSENTNINIPNVIDIIKKNELTALATSLVDVNVPSKDQWERKDLCAEIVNSGSSTLNELIDNKDIESTVSDSTYCKMSVSRINELSESIEKRLRVGKYDMGRYIDVFQSVVEILNDAKFDINFCHNDFTVNNYGFSSGIQPIYDWENAGLYDPKWDIASFETGIIGEYIRYHHNEQYVQNMKKQFYKTLDYSIENNENYDMFRLFHIIMVLSYLNHESLSRAWDSISGINDAFNIKNKQFEGITSKYTDIF